MLKTMRQRAKYFYVLFVIVILSFIFWGVGRVDQSGPGGGIVAEVGKYKITEQEYYRALDNAQKFYRDLYKEKFDEEMQKQLNLKEKVLDTLVGNRVLLIAAAENGIKVTNDELNEVIVNEPVFRKNGVFDPKTYENVLRQSRMSPEIYETAKREELTVMKMRRLVELSASPAAIDLGNLTADEQTMKALKDALQNDAKEKAVEAYIAGYKTKIKVKENRQLIS